MHYEPYFHENINCHSYNYYYAVITMLQSDYIVGLND